MNKKRVFALILSAVLCMSFMAGCGGSGKDQTSGTSAASTVSGSDTESKTEESKTEESKTESKDDKTSEVSETEKEPETSMHTLYVRDDDKCPEIKATFINNQTGATEDVVMTRTDEKDNYFVYTCEGDTDKYNMVQLHCGEEDTGIVAFNKFVSGWYMNSTELLPCPAGAEPNYSPVYETKVMKFEEEDKNIYIWKPADYDANSADKYATIYMLDGQTVLSTEISGNVRSWNVAESVENMMAATDNKAILVCIDTLERRDEDLIPDIGTPVPGYKLSGERRGGLFADFVANTLMPYIQENYNVYTDKLHNSIAGSSFGGLEAFYIGMEYPDKFGTIGSFSCSAGVFDQNVWEKYLSTKTYDENLPFLYMYSGSFAMDTGYVDEIMYNYLLSKSGYPKDKIVFSKDEEGDHKEEYWRNTYPEFLEAMFTQKVSALQSGVPVAYKNRTIPQSDMEIFEDSDEESYVDDRPESIKNYVFYDNSETKWENVYAYWFGSGAFPTNKVTGAVYYNDWPGTKMEQIEGTDIYRVEAPLNVTTIIFDSGITDPEVIKGVIAYQTVDLPYTDKACSGKVYKIDMSVAPKKGSGVEKTKFRYKEGSWSEVDPEVAGA